MPLLSFSHAPDRENIHNLHHMEIAAQPLVLKKIFYGIDEGCFNGRQLRRGFRTVPDRVAYRGRGK